MKKEKVEKMAKNKRLLAWAHSVWYIFANLLQHIKHSFAMKGRFVRLKHNYTNFFRLYGMNSAPNFSILF